MLLSNERNELRHTTTWHYTKWKKPMSKVTHYIVPFMLHPWKDKTVMIDNRLPVAKSYG